MICLMSCQVRFSVAGSLARAFQKLLIQSVLRVAMMSSYTSRTSGEASLYSMKPRVGIDLRSKGGLERRQSSTQGWPHYLSVSSGVSGFSAVEELTFREWNQLMCGSG